MFELPNNFFGEREEATKKKEWIEENYKNLYCNVLPYSESQGYLVEVFTKENDQSFNWNFSNEIRSTSFVLPYKYNGGTGEAVISANSKEQAICKFENDPAYNQATLV